MAVRTPTNPLGLTETDVVRVVEVVQQRLSDIETDAVFTTAASSVIEEAFRVIGVNEYEHSPLSHGEERSAYYRFVQDAEEYEVTVRARNIDVE